jgi:hypothetical protein
MINASKVEAVLSTSVRETGARGRIVGVGGGGVAEGIGVTVRAGAGWHAARKTRMMIVVPRIFCMGFLLFLVSKGTMC